MDLEELVPAIAPAPLEGPVTFGAGEVPGHWGARAWSLVADAHADHPTDAVFQPIGAPGNGV